MDEKLRRYYLESQVKNSSPGQMLLMLYDGLIQHAELADVEISAAADPVRGSEAAHAVSRCINILTELTSSLRHQVDPGLCATLSKLYLFFTKELAEALDRRNPEKIRAILPLIRQLRTSWFEANRQVSLSQAVAA